MADFEKHSCEVSIDLDIMCKMYRLEDVMFTFTPEKFGINEWMHLEWYERRVPNGLLQQFPCLYYLVEDIWKEATKMTPLEEIEYKKTI